MLEKELKNDRPFQELCKAFAGLNSAKDTADFLRDVATFSEIKAMSERLAAAKLIEEGIPYRAIQKKTGASTTTVTRVAHWLLHGCGGYAKALKLLK
jgi:TrpR-related protein YerC/YecD